MHGIAGLSWPRGVKISLEDTVTKYQSLADHAIDVGDDTSSLHAPYLVHFHSLIRVQNRPIKCFKCFTNICLQSYDLTLLIETHEHFIIPCSLIVSAADSDVDADLLADKIMLEIKAI
jgi:hypothetical protein